MPRILVADDNSNIQKMAALALKEAGIEVVAVGNGEAAVRKLLESQPDLVLADVFMPVRNGYEVCEFIKRDARFAHIPVILLVGAFDPLDEREAQRVRADGVLKKPFVPPDPLVNMVKSLLAKSASERLAAVPAPEPAPVVVGAHAESAPSPSAPVTFAPAAAARVAEESSEEHEDLPEEFSLPNVKMEEHDQPVAFSALLDSPAFEADAEITVTATRDPNLGEPSFWTPPPDVEPSVTEEPTDHTWGAENDVLAPHQEATPLRPVELAAQFQTEVPGWVPQVPPPNHFSMEEVSADSEEELGEAGESSTPKNFAAATLVPLDAAALSPYEILLPKAAEETPAPTAADGNGTSAAFDLNEPEFSAEPAREISSSGEPAAEPLSATVSSTMASAPLAALDEAAGGSEPPAVGRRMPLLEVLGIEPDEEPLIARERAHEAIPAMQVVEDHSEPWTAPEGATAVPETQQAAEATAGPFSVPVPRPESISQARKLTVVSDALQGTAAAPELTLTPVSAAELAPSSRDPLDPSAIAAIVDRVIERLQPTIMDVVNREILRPVVEALVERELKQQ